MRYFKSLVCFTCLSSSILANAKQYDSAIPDDIDTPYESYSAKDGVPSEKSIKKVYKFVDFSRKVEAFLQGVPAASLHKLYTSYLKIAGGATGNVLIADKLLDSKPLFLTGNTDTIYAQTFVDLRNGPVVVEVPPMVLGTVNDHFFRFVIDMGAVGPDKGKGGKFLLYPPGVKAKKVRGYYTAQSRTYINWVILRAFQNPKDGVVSAVKAYKSKFKVYPYAMRRQKSKTKYMSMSDIEMDTIHASDHSFYNELNEVIQYEPTEAITADQRGVFASIGIAKGKQFKPTKDEIKTLDQAAYTASVYARGLLYEPRDKTAYVYKGKQWITAFLGGDYRWLTKDGARNFDARTYFFYMATVNTPAMVLKLIGKGSQYALVTKDKDGEYFEGDELYKLHLDKDIPIKNFWSFVVYDNQTRSEIQSEPFPSLNSMEKKIQKNADGSIDIYIGPKAPKGKESNFIKTDPDKGWFGMYRFYGPTEKYYDKSWQLNDIEEM